MKDPQDTLRIAHWRQQAIAGTLSLEDQIAAVKLLRADRYSAAAASAGAKVKRAKAAGPVINGDDLLGEMLG